MTGTWGTQRMQGGPSRENHQSKGAQNILLRFFQQVEQAEQMIGIIATPFAIVATTWLIHRIQMISDGGQLSRPYGIAYIAPIALITLFSGWIPGVCGLVMACAALVYLLIPFPFNPTGRTLDFTEIGLLIIVGTLVIYGLDAARKNRHLIERMKIAQNARREAESQRADFSREVLLAVTGGCLQLASDAEIDKMTATEPVLISRLANTQDLPLLRSRLRDIIAEFNISQDRSGDLLIGTCEAATNALKHAGGGTVKVWVNKDEVSVLISDFGHGIHPSVLARATLEQGYSSKSTLGVGFTLILQFVDKMILNTSSTGTRIILKVCNRSRPTAQDSIMSQYSDLKM